MRFVLLLVASLLSLQAGAALPALPAAALDSPAALDAAMPGLARDLLDRGAGSGEDAAALNLRFRLEMVAGEHDRALASIAGWRGVAPPGASPPSTVFVQYEVAAATRRDEARAGPGPAFERAFERYVGALDDRAADDVRFAFGASLPGFASMLEAQLGALRGSPTMTVDQAMALVRAYHQHRSYALLLPRAAGAFAKDDERRYVAEDRLVVLPDGRSSRVLAMRPRGATGRLPTLYNHSIYADREAKLSEVRAAAARGFAGVASFTPGKLGSGGTVVPYEGEGRTAIAVVDWISRQPWSDGRVGMYGGSYEGFVQWAAARIGHPALRAIMPAVAVAPGIDTPMEGGIFQSYFYRWIPYATGNDTLDVAANDDHERWQRLDREAYRSGRAYRDLPAIDGQPSPFFERWIAHPTFDAYWQALTPQAEDFARIDIPVLSTSGYYDGCLLSTVHYFREHLRNNPRADHTLVLGPYDHWSGQFRAGPELLGYRLDPSALVDMRALRFAWYAHLFQGAERPLLLADRVNFQVMGADTWRHVRHLDAMATDRLALHLGPADQPGNHALLLAPATAGPPARLEVDLADRSDADREYPREIFGPAPVTDDALVLTSGPFPDGIEVSGVFTAHLDFSINKRDVDLSLELYEMLPDGNYLRLGSLMARASQWQDRRQRQLLEPGKRYQWAFESGRPVSRRLAPGSRLLAVLGVVKFAGAQVNLGSGKPVAEETIADAGEPLEIQWYPGSRLELPVRR